MSWKLYFNTITGMAFISFTMYSAFQKRAFLCSLGLGLKVRPVYLENYHLREQDERCEASGVNRSCTDLKIPWVPYLIGDSVEQLLLR